MAVDFFQFCMNLLLAGFLFRFAQVKLQGTDIGKALAFIY